MGYHDNEFIISYCFADDEAEGKKKKKAKPFGKEKVGFTSRLGFGSENAEYTKKTKTIFKQVIRTPQPDGSFTSKEIIIRDPKAVTFEQFPACMSCDK